MAMAYWLQPRATANTPLLTLSCVFASLLMALTYIGGDIAQSQLGLPAAAIQVFQGMLLFFILALDLLTNYRLRISNVERKS